jgi:hypothetical protein
MKKMLKLFAITCTLFLLAAHGVCAQRAIIRDFAGTVEVKLPGSEAWVNAVKEQTLTGDAVISTGFRSTALIEIGDSLLTVRPLTRLTITELSQNRETEKIDLNLQAGRVRAEVSPSAGANIDFTVRSSAATASVRGTIFNFDTFNLTVNEGTVEFSGAAGSPVLIDAGGSVQAGERGERPVASPPTDTSELRPDLPVAADTVQPAQPEKAAPTDPSLSISIDLR